MLKAQDFQDFFPTYLKLKPRIKDFHPDVEFSSIHPHAHAHLSPVLEWTCFVSSTLRKISAFLQPID
jgi:hypothetical protein